MQSPDGPEQREAYAREQTDTALERLEVEAQLADDATGDFAPHACESMCDCGAPGGYPHEPDCHSYRTCGEAGYCDKHYEAKRHAHAWMRGLSRGMALGVPDASERWDLMDAGRGRLLGYSDFREIDIEVRR